MGGKVSKEQCNVRHYKRNLTTVLVRKVEIVANSVDSLLYTPHKSLSMVLLGTLTVCDDEQVKR